MWWGIYAVALLVALVASGVIGVLRGYAAVYGVMITLFAFAMTALLGGVGALIAPLAVERWTREPPQAGRGDHPVRWPYRSRTFNPT